MPGSQTAAHCYCGHQFGHFSGQLGDGAAIYLGEVWQCSFAASSLELTSTGRFLTRQNACATQIRVLLYKHAGQSACQPPLTTMASSPDHPQTANRQLSCLSVGARCMHSFLLCPVGEAAFYKAIAHQIRAASKLNA